MESGLLVDALPETPVMDAHHYEYGGKITYDSIATWPPKRAPIPFFKPHFDGHYTPVSKFVSQNEGPSQIPVRELTPTNNVQPMYKSDIITYTPKIVQSPLSEPIPSSLITRTPIKSSSSKVSDPISSESVSSNKQPSPSEVNISNNQSTSSKMEAVSEQSTPRSLSERIAQIQSPSPVLQRADESLKESSVDSPISHDDIDAKAASFWLAPSMNRRIHQRPHTSFADSVHSRHRPHKPIPIPIVLGLKDEDLSDNASLSSYSELSDDSTPRSPPPKFERLTSAKETRFFCGLYQDISDALDRWEADVKKTGRTIENIDVSHQFVDLPDYFEKDVLMGKRPDDKGYWTGGLNIHARGELHPLNTGRDEKVYGFICGWVDDFNCRTYAVLLMGTDKKIYYYDADGELPEDEEWDYKYYANGSYDLRRFGTAYVLDPFPPHSVHEMSHESDLIRL